MALANQKEIQELVQLQCEIDESFLQSWQEAGDKFQTSLPLKLDSFPKNCGIKPNRYIWEE
tara:strand:+ start:321 stop:503 length:183 start_codon:yes stop_codon:yes gene_type:complete